jgi:hypothetical protein
MKPDRGWMWDQSGCKYPYGRRPTFWGFYLCDGLWRHMSWFDFFRYVWVSGKYLSHLSRSVQTITIEWRQPQAHVLKSGHP